MTNPLISARDGFAAAHPEERVTLNTRDWGVIDTGTGPVLLLLPGTLGRGDIFWQQIAALTELRVIAVSYPASGTIVDWTADLVALLEARGVAQVAVLGSSLGGYLAQYFAAMHPERVTHLFAANTLAATEGIDARPPYALDIWATPIDGLRAGFGMAMQAWGQTHPEQADLVDLLLAESQGRILDDEMRARLDALKTAPALPADPRPAGASTVIETDDDPLLPPPLRAGVRARLAGSEAFRFQWGGHFPYVLRPALYTGLIRARLGLATLPAEWNGGSA
ncbi:MAG: alpha/beta hydrolase [Rhodobacter sp.]|nr:alpha/beta hydrolase [Paracoccaceae bacterium]MCC0075267.1 alpha/beta hydrolase [Rhodobacter sp.]